MTETTNLGRRGFLKLGAGGAALLSLGSAVSVLSGCSKGPKTPAEGFLHLRASDLEVLRPWVPAVLSAEARPNGEADIERSLKVLDGLLDSAGPIARKMLFELYDVLHLGAFRWWATGVWSDPASLTLEERIAALDTWEHIDSTFGRVAFRGLTSPLMAGWYQQPDMAKTTGYPGPPKKIVG